MRESFDFGNRDRIEFKAPFVSGAEMATNDSGLAFKRWGRTQPFMKYGIPMILVTVFGALGYGRLLKGRQHMYNWSKERTKNYDARSRKGVSKT
ncbi:uncharacterized protein LOC115984349 [Quercus lobata]|uniref:uncharacterized protein LOC115984349 n=1 Tax=Quercus lobata TaxID=97700 RepID=UPI001243D16D|nr:uncharacterized protein LOC115984349 [Quercus lobata]